MATKVLITGVTAFVGSHLADYLLDKVGVEVHGVKRPRSRDEFIRKDIIYHEADVTDYVGLSEVVRSVKPDYIFHLAAQSFVPLSWKAPEATLITNIVGTLNMLEAIKNYSPDTTMHFAGSSEEYGFVLESELPVRETNPLRPLSPYGVSKVSADLLCQQYWESYKIKVVITRAFNHTGPRRGEVFVTSNFAKQIAQIELGGEPKIYVGNLEAKRDFSDVRDIVRAYWMSVDRCSYGRAYNICSGKTYSIRKVLKMLLSHTSNGIEVIQEAERLRPSDVPLLSGDCSDFKKQTGWEPLIPIETTLLDLLNYWRKRVGGGRAT